MNSQENMTNNKKDPQKMHRLGSLIGENQLSVVRKKLFLLESVKVIQESHIPTRSSHSVLVLKYRIPYVTSFWSVMIFHRKNSVHKYSSYRSETVSTDG